MRDFATEMRALIDAETSAGPYVSRHIARDIVDKLETADPELLAGWLHEQAEQLVWGAINYRDRSRRAHARTTGPRSAFAEAAVRHDEGDPRAMTGWLGCRYVVAPEGTRKVLADLNRDELIYVARGYEKDSRSLAMEAAFFRALARKVKDGPVSEYFTEDQLLRLRESLLS
jgi:hypothetical protein